MKISTRLLVLLFALLALVAVAGGVGIYSSGRVDTAFKSAYDDRMLPIVQLNIIARKNLQNRIAVANAVILPEHMAEYVTQIEDNRVEIDKQWNAYMATSQTDEQKGLVAQFSEARRRFVEEGLKPAMTAMQAHDVERIKQIQAQKIRPLFVPFEESLNALIALQISEAKKGYDESNASYKFVRMLSVGLVIAGLAAGTVFGLSIIRGIRRSVDELCAVMVRMAADGDLSVRARIYGKDEIGQASATFNGLIEGFANIMRKVTSSADTVFSTAASLSGASLQISQGSQAQSEAAASTAAAVEEITVSINSVAANTDEVRKMSEKSLRQTQQGNQNVATMIGEIERGQEAVNQIAVSVKEFVESTRAIAGMTQQVKDIADQTNLLALNAAFEAARAGEQGRGFAVVADEVRKLAEKSAQSAGEIDRVTNSLNQKSTYVEATVQSGLRSLQTTQEHVERVSTVLTEAGDSVEQSSRGVSDIAASVSEQSLASNEIARNVEKIAQMSEENHAAADLNAQQIMRLEQLARELQGEISRFKV